MPFFIDKNALFEFNCFRLCLFLFVFGFKSKVNRLVRCSVFLVFGVAFRYINFVTVVLYEVVRASNGVLLGVASRYVESFWLPFIFYLSDNLLAAINSIH
jgi:hypothetical protein